MKERAHNCATAIYDLVMVLSLALAMSALGSVVFHLWKK